MQTEEFIAPENFSMVEKGVYRSAFPRSKHLSFLRRLKLKTVFPLVLEDYQEQLVEFFKKSGISVKAHGVDGNKGPFKGIDIDTFSDALRDILDESNRPCLIHCNKGKHRTGCVVGCLRKVRGWALSSIVDEYIIFSCPKSRLEDQRFIESFDLDEFEESSQAILENKPDA
jgi:tyrosine-protein phosphatase SIW14